jgi:hypothetical protein
VTDAELLQAMAKNVREYTDLTARASALERGARALALEAELAKAVSIGEELNALAASTIGPRVAAVLVHFAETQERNAQAMREASEESASHGDDGLARDSSAEAREHAYAARILREIAKDFGSQREGDSRRDEGRVAGAGTGMSDTGGIPHPIDVFQSSPREAWVVAADGDCLARCNGNAAWLMTAKDVAARVRDALALVEAAKGAEAFGLTSNDDFVWLRPDDDDRVTISEICGRREALAARLIATALKLLEQR